MLSFQANVLTDKLTPHSLHEIFRLHFNFRLNDKRLMIGVSFFTSSKISEEDMISQTMAKRSHFMEAI